jgi:hypothetical protein
MTKITEAYRQWAELWRDFDTDAENEAAGVARRPLEDVIAGEPASCLEDVICKLRVFRELDGWVHHDEVLSDAIGSIELSRGNFDAIDPAVALYQRWATLRRQSAELPDTHAGDEQRDRLCVKWTEAALVLSRTTATTLPGIAAKLRVLEAEMEAGDASDGRDRALAQTARQDLDRLAGAAPAVSD